MTGIPMLPATTDKKDVVAEAQLLLSDKVHVKLRETHLSKQPFRVEHAPVGFAGYTLARSVVVHRKTGYCYIHRSALVFDSVPTYGKGFIKMDKTEYGLVIRQVNDYTVFTPIHSAPNPDEYLPIPLIYYV